MTKTSSNIKDFLLAALAIALCICLFILFKKSNSTSGIYNIGIDSVASFEDHSEYVLIYKKPKQISPAEKTSVTRILGTIDDATALEYHIQYKKLIDSLGWGDIEKGQTRVIDFDLAELRDYVIKCNNLGESRIGKTVRLYFGRHPADDKVSPSQLTAFFAPVSTSDKEVNKLGLEYFNIGKLCPIICPPAVDATSIFSRAK